MAGLTRIGGVVSLMAVLLLVVMIFQAQSYLSSAWWMAFLPGMAIFFAVLGFTLLGDGVREALDPPTYD